MLEFKKDQLRLVLALALALGCTSATLSGTLAALSYGAEGPAKLATVAIV